MISLMADENLSLMLQTSKGAGMDDAITITLKGGSRRAFGLCKQAAFGISRLARKWCAWLVAKTQSVKHVFTSLQKP
jgi:hypothetical protein